MARIAVLGDGRMGSRICALAKQFNLEPALILGEHNNKNGSGITPDNFNGIDVAIDFTHPDVIKNHIEKIAGLGVPLVVGTTGWYNKSGWVEQLAKDKNTAIVYGSNFSLGVQLFLKLMNQAGKLYGQSNFFDASLHEIHHKEKADAPSGTAVTMAELWLKGAGSDNETAYGIPQRGKVDPNKFIITSQRTGSVFGEHSIQINSDYDDIKLTHSARSRDGFAAGALKTANWLIGQKKAGFYLIEDIVEQVLKN
jgi:4-hydroxy-tetrahydrodipicolinate reductase